MFEPRLLWGRHRIRTIFDVLLVTIRLYCLKKRQIELEAEYQTEWIAWQKHSQLLRRYGSVRAHRKPVSPVQVLSASGLRFYFDK